MKTFTKTFTRTQASKLRRASLLAALVLAAALPARASLIEGTILYETNFTGDNGTSPAGWTAYAPGDNTATIQSNKYRFNRPDGGSGSAIFSRFTGSYDPEDGDPLAAADWTDYRIDAVIQSTALANTVTRNGLIARYDQTTGPANDNAGYHGMLRYINASNFELRILKGFDNTDSQSGDANGTLLASEEFNFALSNNTDYRMFFEVVGNKLTLGLSNMDGTSVFSVSATDTVSPILSGAPGLRTYHSSNNRRTDWDDFTVTVIPEPGTLFLLLNSGLVLLLLGRRRSK